MQETYRIQEHQVLAFDSVVQVKMCFPKLNSDIKACARPEAYYCNSAHCASILCECYKHLKE